MQNFMLQVSQKPDLKMTDLRGYHFQRLVSLLERNKKLREKQTVCRRNKQFESEFFITLKQGFKNPFLDMTLVTQANSHDEFQTLKMLYLISASLYLSVLLITKTLFRQKFRLQVGFHQSVFPKGVMCISVLLKQIKIMRDKENIYKYLQC